MHLQANSSEGANFARFSVKGEREGDKASYLVQDERRPEGTDRSI